MKIYRKIKAAREILSKTDIAEKFYDKNIIQKLKEVTDKVELTYNDVKIKRLRSKAAEHMMKELEKELNVLLQESENIYHL
jgi:hypothetical protein